MRRSPLKGLLEAILPVATALGVRECNEVGVEHFEYSADRQGRAGLPEVRNQPSKTDAANAGQCA
jgi:hypothetical protein